MVAILQEITDFYATDNLMIVAFLIIGCAAAIGHLLDRTLGELAFGLVGNSALVLMSILVATSIGREHVMLISTDESIRVAILACTLSTGLLLGLGALKAYLLRWRV
ncbi:MAG: hypothetical protein KDJ29_18535 [Hyphomicrobiales bacterium]|nr:hypothetical protein [Hyphomicrobiales bacterium]